MSAERAPIGPREDDNVLSPNQLKIELVTEKGGKILDGKGQLMRLESFEDREFLVRLKDQIITPNPSQPRKFFDPAKMDELRGTLKSQGQQEAIKVVPYFDGSKIKLFIIDGERRFRVFREDDYATIRVIIKWAKDEDDVFEQSLIYNESKAEHNAMERAHAYKRMFDSRVKKGMRNPLQDMAKKLGIPEYKISRHLQLLELPEPFQDMVMRGEVPLNNALIIRQLLKKFGKDLPIAKLAQALMDAVRSDDPRSPRGGGGLTRQSVTDAVRKALAEEGHVDASSELGARKAVFDVMFGLGRAFAGNQRLQAANPDKVVGVFRSRKGEPPELVRDRINEVQAGLDRVLALVVRAIAPDPLPDVAGKKPFFEFIRGKGKSFGHELRFTMACILAKASDKEGGQILRAPELAKLCNVTVADIGSNLPRLEIDLKGLGLRLDQQIVREKVKRIRRGKQVFDYEQYPAYRLAWITEKEARAAATAVAKSTPAVAAPSRAKSVRPAPEPPPTEGGSLVDHIFARRTTFGDDINVLQIANILAGAADRGQEPMSVKALAKATGTKKHADVTGHMGQVREKLANIGIELVRSSRRDETVFSISWRQAPKLALVAIQAPRGSHDEGDEEAADDDDAPAGGRPSDVAEDLFDDPETKPDEEGEVDPDIKIAEVELGARRRHPSRPPARPASVPLRSGATVDGKATRIELLRAANARSREREVAMALVDMRDIQTDAPPNLQTAVKEIARFVVATVGKEASYQTWGKSKFGSRLGFTIEERKRGLSVVYCVRSNMRGFKLNCGVYRDTFARKIATALGRPSDEIEVMVSDFD